MSDLATIHPFQASRMTEAEYLAARGTLRATYGDTKDESNGRREQALAKLFLQSGWTQEELAKVEGRSRIWVTCHLRFGRFLEFVTTVTNSANPGIPLDTLIERQFRGYWSRTDASESNDRIRYGAVLRLMQDETTLSKSHRSKSPIGEAIKATIDEGWHRLSTIVAKVQAVVPEATTEDVAAVLKGMVQHGWYNVFCEKKKGDQVYRVVVGGKQKVDLVVVKHEFGPIIAGLKAEGRKNMATMSPGTVAKLASALERILEKLARRASI